MVLPADVSPADCDADAGDPILDCCSDGVVENCDEWVDSSCRTVVSSRDDAVVSSIGILDVTLGASDELVCSVTNTEAEVVVSAALGCVDAVSNGDVCEGRGVDASSVVKTCVIGSAVVAMRSLDILLAYASDVGKLYGCVSDVCADSTSVLSVGETPAIVDVCALVFADEMCCGVLSSLEVSAGNRENVVPADAANVDMCSEAVSDNRVVCDDVVVSSLCLVDLKLAVDDTRNCSEFEVVAAALGSTAVVSVVDETAAGVVSICDVRELEKVEGSV